MDLNPSAIACCTPTCTLFSAVRIPPLTHVCCRYDTVREGVVVFLGTLARHLPPGDPKRATIVETLVTVLGTPSEVWRMKVA